MRCVRARPCERACARVRARARASERACVCACARAGACVNHLTEGYEWSIWTPDILLINLGKLFVCVCVCVWVGVCQMVDLDARCSPDKPGSSARVCVWMGVGGREEGLEGGREGGSACIHTHTHTRTHTQTQTQTQIRARARTHTHAHTQTQIRTHPPYLIRHEHQFLLDTKLDNISHVVFRQSVAGGVAGVYNHKPLHRHPVRTCLCAWVQ